MHSISIYIYPKFKRGMVQKLHARTFSLHARASILFNQITDNEPWGLPIVYHMKNLDDFALLWIALGYINCSLYRVFIHILEGFFTSTKTETTRVDMCWIERTILQQRPNGVHVSWNTLHAHTIISFHLFQNTGQLSVNCLYHAFIDISIWCSICRHWRYQFNLYI